MSSWKRWNNPFETAKTPYILIVQPTDKPGQWAVFLQKSDMENDLFVLANNLKMSRKASIFIRNYAMRGFFIQIRLNMR